MKSSREVMRLLRDERGSASVEVVIFAMPLFIPLILLASQMTAVSAAKIEISHLARTSLRAFVTASSTPLGHARVQQVLELADTSQGGGGKFSYLIECRRTPCIQPANRVRITLEDRDVGVAVTASLSTDHWIQGELGNVRGEDRILGFRDVADAEERLAPFLDAKELIDQAREILNSLSSR